MSKFLEMIDCISRKGRNIDEVTAVLDDAMGIIKDRMPDLYHETIHN